MSEREGEDMRKILAGVAVVGMLVVGSPAQAASSVQYLYANVGETPQEVGAADTIVTTQAGGAFLVQVYEHGGVTDYNSAATAFYVDGPTVCEFKKCNAQHPVTNYDCSGVASGGYVESTCGFASAPAGQWHIWINAVDSTPEEDVTLANYVTVSGDYLVVTGPGPFNERH